MARPCLYLNFIMLVPLHPAIVHFPIALITAALILHGIQLWKPNWLSRVVGLWLMGLATISAIAAVLTGQKEAAKAGKIGYPTETLILIERHETFGNIVVWGSILFFIGWVYFFFKYKNDIQLDRLALAFLLLLFMIVTVSAYTGGQLVYIHGGGTP